VVQHPRAGLVCTRGPFRHQTEAAAANGADQVGPNLVADRLNRHVTVGATDEHKLPPEVQATCIAAFRRRLSAAGRRMSSTVAHTREEKTAYDA